MNTELKALEDMVRAAVEAEGVPLPPIWKNSVVELCVRVISKYAMDQQPRAALATAEAQPAARTPTTGIAAQGDPRLRAGAGSLVGATRYDISDPKPIAHVWIDHQDERHVLPFAAERERFNQLPHGTWLYLADRQPGEQA